MFKNKQNQSVKIAFTIGAMVLLAGCGDAPTEGRDADNADGVTLAAGRTPGIDVGTINRAIRPGEDFAAHANGRRAAGPSPFGMARQAAVATTISSLEEAAGGDATTPAAVAAARVSACMALAAIDASGFAPFAAPLAELRAISTMEDLARVFADPGLAPLAPFAFYIADAPASGPEAAIAPRLHIAQNGLGLSDRMAYLDPARFEERTRYGDYLTTLLEMAAAPDAAAAAEAVLDLETAIATRHWTEAKAASRDLSHRPATLASLAAIAPGFAWRAWTDALGVSEVNDVVLREDTALAALAMLVAETPVETWRAYLVAHFLDAYAGIGPQALRAASAEFAGRSLDDLEAPAARADACLERNRDLVVATAGDLISWRIAPTDVRAASDTLAWDVRAAVEDRLSASDQLTETARVEATRKLAALTILVGDMPEPGQGGPRSTLASAPGQSLLVDAIETSRWAWRQAATRLEASGDRRAPAWRPAPWEPTAVYDPASNTVMISAALLQPPFFDPNATPAANFGALGAIIGHEVAHAFDAQGRLVDAEGRMNAWWSEEDSSRWAHAAALIAASSGDAGEAVSTESFNGASEDLADLAGLAAAHDAWRARSARDGGPDAVAGIDGAQVFFLAWAQLWRGGGDQFTRASLAPRHLSAWYDAFSIDDSDGEYVPPTERAKAW